MLPKRALVLHLYCSRVEQLGVHGGGVWEFLEAVAVALHRLLIGPASSCQDPSLLSECFPMGKKTKCA